MTKEEIKAAIHNNADRKTRTPRSAESIIKGALSLPLDERAKLRDAIIESITTEVAKLEEQTKYARSLLNGTK